MGRVIAKNRTRHRQQWDASLHCNKATRQTTQRVIAKVHFVETRHKYTAKKPTLWRHWTETRHKRHWRVITKTIHCGDKARKCHYMSTRSRKSRYPMVP